MVDLRRASPMPTTPQIQPKSSMVLLSLQGSMRQITTTFLESVLKKNSIVGRVMTQLGPNYPSPLILCTIGRARKNI